ncbi:MAG: YncE family protein [Candidatus Micrarchaeaceae archaeon]
MGYTRAIAAVGLLLLLISAFLVWTNTAGSQISLAQLYYELLYVLFGGLGTFGNALLAPSLTVTSYSQLALILSLIALPLGFFAAFVSVLDGHPSPYQSIVSTAGVLLWIYYAHTTSSIIYIGTYVAFVGAILLGLGYVLSNKPKRMIGPAITVLIIPLIIFFLLLPNISSSLLLQLNNYLQSIGTNNHTIQMIYNNYIYIAQTSNNEVMVFDMKTNNIVSEINLGSISPKAIATNSNYLYVAGSYYNYHNPKYHGIILVINRTNNKIIYNISMASIPDKIVVTPNGTYAYTLNSNNTESSINLQNRMVAGSFLFTTQYQGENGAPEGLILAPNKNILYVLVNYGNCEYQSMSILSSGRECSDEILFALNASNINQTIWSIPIYPYNIYASGSHELAISPNGNMLYAIIGSQSGPDTTLAIINTTTENEVKIFNFSSEQGQSSLSMSPGGAYLYLIYRGIPEDVAVINTSTESVVDSINVAGLAAEDVPTDVIVEPNFVYIIKSDLLGYSYYLLTINRNNDSVAQSIGLTGCPCEFTANN